MLFRSQDVVADAIDEGAEATRGLNTAGLAKRLHDTEECLLPGVLDLRWGAQTRSQLDRQKIPEIAGEVPLRLRLSRRQTIEVRTVELKSPFAWHASKSYARRLPTRKANRSVTRP